MPNPEMKISGFPVEKILGNLVSPIMFISRHVLSWGTCHWIYIWIV